MTVFTRALSTNNYGPASIIVDANAANGTHSTIQAAITAAAVGSTIFIRNGSYTENLTLAAGVNLVGWPGDGETPTVTITGKMIASFTGTCTISGVRLVTNADSILGCFGANATTVNILNCELRVVDSIGITSSCSNAAAKIIVNNSFINIENLTRSTYSSSSVGTIEFNSCRMENSGASLATSNNSAGTVKFRYCVGIPVVSTTGTGTLQISLSTVDTASINTVSITHSGTGSNSFVENSAISSGTAVAITIGAGATLEVSNTKIKSTNANTTSGGGTLNYGDLIFTDTSNKLATTTQVPRVESNDACKVVTPGAYPYTCIPQDGVILVDSAGGTRTINLNASPVTGQIYRIKDAGGNAATNNITITPAAGNIDGASTSVMNVDYMSRDVVFGGTEWLIL